MFIDITQWFCQASWWMWDGFREIWRQGALDYLWHRGQGQTKQAARETVLLSHEVQKRPPFVLSSFSEQSLCVPNSKLSPRLMSQWFMSQGLYVYNQSFVSLSWRFQSLACYLLITYWESLKSGGISQLREVTLRATTQSKDPGKQSTALQERSMSPGCSLFMK